MHGAEETVETVDLRAVTLELLGRFSIRCGETVEDVALTGQKVIALIALHGGAVHRSRLAATLWPDSPDDRSVANLRSAMWRMPEAVRTRVERHGMTIGFGPGWIVDVDRTETAAAQLRRTGSAGGIDRHSFAMDLLPGWDEDWLVVLRERHRQLRLHALEELAHAELADDRPLDAVDTAMQAISDEPLRESAQLLLLQAHLQAGNRAAVMRRFSEFRDMLAAELHIEPSRQMIDVYDLACS